MKPTLFLHLGMSKTATTWFQQEVFPQYPDIEFRDQPHGNGALEGGSMQGMLARAFRRSPMVWQSEARALFSDLLGTPDGQWPLEKSLLISDQSAGPRLLEYGNYKGPHWEQERMDPMILAAHLHQMTSEATKRGFGQIKIILVFRRQDQWLASKYAQRSDRIAGASQCQFEDRIDYYLSRSRGYYSDGLILDYDLLYDQLSRAIGAENILFLPYELLKTEPETFLQRVSEFISPGDSLTRENIASLGLRAASKRTNVRSRGSSEWALRRPQTKSSLEHVARVLPRKFFRTRHKPSYIQMTDDLEQRILATYRHSNTSLGEKLGFDLGSLGYFG